MWGGGYAFVAPVLGLLQSWPLPRFQELLVRSQQGDCGSRGAGRGKGSLDKRAHTRQMFAQKNTVKSSCKYNRESAFSHHWLLRLLAFLFRQSGVRRGWEAGLGELREVCSAYPCWPPPFHSPGEQSFLCKCHPQSEPRAWSVPQVGVREVLS